MTCALNNDMSVLMEILLKILKPNMDHGFPLPPRRMSAVEIETMQKTTRNHAFLSGGSHRVCLAESVYTVVCRYFERAFSMSCITRKKESFVKQPSGRIWKVFPCTLQSSKIMLLPFSCKLRHLPLAGMIAPILLEHPRYLQAGTQQWIHLWCALSTFPGILLAPHNLAPLSSKRHRLWKAPRWLQWPPMRFLIGDLL